MSGPPGVDPPESAEFPPVGGSQPAPSEPGYFVRAKASGYMPDAEERQNALFAHLLGAIADLLCCGVLGAPMPLLVLLMTKRRTAFELFHIYHSVLFQLVLLGFLLASWGIAAVLPALGVILSFVLYWISGLAVFAALVYAIVVGLGANRGLWRGYVWIDKWVAKLPRILT